MRYVFLKTFSAMCTAVKYINKILCKEWIALKTLDWNKYLEKAAETAAEGVVMLKNDNAALPVSKDEEIAVFGRIQLDYYKSGTGSGGLVNVHKVTGIVDGLLEAGAKINEDLLEFYKKQAENQPFDLGDGWSEEPWCQQEFELTDDIVAKAAETSKAAVVVIGRTAGEEHDNKAEEGSYFLTVGEKDMLKKVRRFFKRMIVVLNVGNIIDMGFVDEFSPDAVLYLWQGGMTGGTGAAKVLLGDVSPCGKLPDTIAYDIADYPSHKYFGNTERNFYTEDIYVGYRWFETFAKDRVRYPFGFGLSYTQFDIVYSAEKSGDEFVISAEVKNIGNLSGKEVIQVYCQAPQGKLGKPLRVLCGYEKTDCLAPGESQRLNISVKLSDIASYDDSGVTGHRFAWVLERGDYCFYAGTDVRSAEKVLTWTAEEDTVVEQLRQALAPVMPFERLGADGTSMEAVPLSGVNEDKRREENIPEEIPFGGDKGIKLEAVAKGEKTLSEFISQLTDKDLNCIIRGEGMCSPRVTAGTAAAFGGVSKRLEELGVPCGCCSDGPSGMRLDCGTKAFSLPNGTLIAATFNKKLITELFEYLGMEMSANGVDCLLGPGMNIHRHPLNGRNFEYFSEDPYLTGTMASAELVGMHRQGVTGTIKHFCGNNQETNRHFLDTAVSERALREIYLKGFEIAVKQGGAKSIMTTYGKVNDLWTAGNFDLNTEILRNQWGFRGFTMTDWWANINVRGHEADKNDFSAMAKAQNDVYMVCSSGESHNDNIMEKLSGGGITRGELQRNAANILRFLIDTNAMRRLMGTEEKVEVINKPESEIDELIRNAPCYDLDRRLTVDLSGVRVERNSDHRFMLNLKNAGMYRVTITASSVKGELMQMPVTLFAGAIRTFTWNGTGGKPVPISMDIPMFSLNNMVRLHFGMGGLDLISIDFELLHEGF